MKLLIDLGNTRLKWATLSAMGLQVGGVFAHAECALIAELRREWRGLARVDAVLVASVVSIGLEQELGAYVTERFGLATQFLRSPAAALGLRNAYAMPERLGIDRFLAMAAALEQRHCACIVISAGTALTLDLADASGLHRGGLIIPGPRLMRSALQSGTARVGEVDGRYLDMPVDTADAVVSGSLYAAIGAIERFRAVALDVLDQAPALLLTGGGADELAPLLDEAQRAHDLVLRGLSLWAQEQ